MPTGSGGGTPNGWPLTYFGVGHQTITGQNAVVNNTVIYFGFFLPALLTFSHLVAFINTADATHNTDIGIYNAGGSSLLANIGAQAISTTGLVSFAVVQGTVSLVPGKYVYAITSAGSLLTLNNDSSIPSWAVSLTGAGSSVGGSLPASFPVTPNYVNPNFGWPFALYS